MSDHIFYVIDIITNQMYYDIGFKTRSFNIKRRTEMKIILHCEPNTPPVPWEEFLEMAPRQSIALDGYVIGRPMFDHKKLVMNANHHEEVDRFSTRCTSAQLALLIRTGLLESFSSSEPIHVYFNDCDQDVCLCIWLLQNIPIARNIMNPVLNRVITIEDMLDTTSGMYGFPPDMSGMEENAWIFEPYSIARSNGTLTRRTPNEFEMIIKAVGSRISESIAGKGERLTLDTRYEIISRHPKWCMVKETGLHARAGMFADGIKAFVSVRPRGDGVTTYSLGRSGIWIPFDIPLVIEKLNEKENNPRDKWGGGDTTGGSPRATGSALSPKEVEETISKVAE